MSSKYYTGYFGTPCYYPKNVPSLATREAVTAMGNYEATGAFNDGKGLRQAQALSVRAGTTIPGGNIVTTKPAGGQGRGPVIGKPVISRPLPVKTVFVPTKAPVFVPKGPSGQPQGGKGFGVATGLPGQNKPPAQGDKKPLFIEDKKPGAKKQAFITTDKKSYVDDKPLYDAAAARADKDKKDKEKKRIEQNNKAQADKERKAAADAKAASDPLPSLVPPIPPVVVPTATAPAPQYGGGGGGGGGGSSMAPDDGEDATDAPAAEMPKKPVPWLLIGGAAAALYFITKKK